MPDAQSGTPCCAATSPCSTSPTSTSPATTWGRSPRWAPPPGRGLLGRGLRPLLGRRGLHHAPPRLRFPAYLGPLRGRARGLSDGSHAGRLRAWRRRGRTAAARDAVLAPGSRPAPRRLPRGHRSHGARNAHVGRGGRRRPPRGGGHARRSPEQRRKAGAMALRYRIFLHSYLGLQQQLHPVLRREGRHPRRRVTAAERHPQDGRRDHPDAEEPHPHLRLALPPRSPFRPAGAARSPSRRPRSWRCQASVKDVVFTSRRQDRHVGHRPLRSRRHPQADHRAHAHATSRAWSSRARRLLVLRTAGRATASTTRWSGCPRIRVVLRHRRRVPRLQPVAHREQRRAPREVAQGHRADDGVRPPHRDPRAPRRGQAADPGGGAGGRRRAPTPSASTGRSGTSTSTTTYTSRARTAPSWSTG